MNAKLIFEINKINKDILKCNVSLKTYNTMKLDSFVKYFIMPTSFIELKKILIILEKFNIKYYILGNGSNIIFTNKEKECIIKLNFKKSKHINILNANDLLIKKSYDFLNFGYSGFEYISNIPASIGGAILMNAGAYNHYFSDIIEYVYYMDEKHNFKVIKKEDCMFSYRNSFFRNKKHIILGCKIKISKGNKDDIKKIMHECKIKRQITQPLDYPNSGSIFKNMANISAWKLIENAGLKGYTKNNAMISEKHCNFIINLGNCHNDDVIFLINLIKKEVKRIYDMCLEEEVIILD